MEAYPAAVAYHDGQGMLPLHLALCYSASDAVLVHLLSYSPDAVSVLGRNGQLTAIECALESSNPARGMMLKLFLEIGKSLPPRTHPAPLRRVVPRRKTRFDPPSWMKVAPFQVYPNRDS